MERIWSIQDQNSFIIALGDHIAEKCQYGDDMDVLTKPERVFYITQSLEMEVNNGGFSQFFYNSSGDFSNELTGSFVEIGANKTAEICQRAVSAFGRDMPSDREVRQEMLDECQNEEIEAILEECDDRFYEYEEDLETLAYAYVVKNKSSFS